MGGEKVSMRQYEDSENLRFFHLTDRSKDEVLAEMKRCAKQEQLDLLCTQVLCSNHETEGFLRFFLFSVISELSTGSCAEELAARCESCDMLTQALPSVFLLNSHWKVHGE